ncbi:PREDICTED: uncharacterized protein LOC109175716 [Ipomoea nil]|uniref:uncharacterized protein LOC109175716 n=1 Tax=Ipomoea nil TaxID=35883 RepID=UPI000900DAEF|nr:PREDICTED: uncharacterized protein LOC109175716 [Ipomoea nil]
MSKQSARSKHAIILEKHNTTISPPRDQQPQKPSNNYFIFSKNLKKVHPINGLHKTCSALSLSSLSLSLSQTSDDSSLTDDSSLSPLDDNISLALGFIAASPERRGSRPPPATRNARRQPCISPARNIPSPSSSEDEVKRCNWITKNSDNVYMQFHDECWGVPVYDDNQLFELLAMSSMLMDFNWTQILKKREVLREAFGGFNVKNVAKMGEKEIQEIASKKALMLTVSRVRCIVQNAKCIMKIVSECGSFSSYMWNHVGFKPIINRFKYPRNVPLRSPKAEMISRDLLKRGFRFVGPVIVYSFMQAAGMTIDHLLPCFRYKDCVNLAS